jgi:hypothetical protein
VNHGQTERSALATSVFVALCPANQSYEQSLSCIRQRRDAIRMGWELAAAQGVDETAHQRSREVIERLVEYLRTMQRP